VSARKAAERLFARNGSDWSGRLPAITEAAAFLKADSFTHLL
jgi:ATP-dependent DNA ligase